MTEDPEIKAMGEVRDALEDLGEDARQRVLRWASERYDVSLGGGGRSTDEPMTGAEEYVSQEQSFDTFADFFHAAQPETEADKVLLAGYWFHEMEGKEELTSRVLNRKLKELGYKVSNITREVRRLMDKKPALVVQLRKKGSSKQAHKVYKLSHAGKKYVEQMFSENRS